jgi:hypothetical protein
MKSKDDERNLTNSKFVILKSEVKKAKCHLHDTNSFAMNSKKFASVKKDTICLVSRTLATSDTKQVFLTFVKAFHSFTLEQVFIVSSDFIKLAKKFYADFMNKKDMKLAFDNYSDITNNIASDFRIRFNNYAKNQCYTSLVQSDTIKFAIADALDLKYFTMSFKQSQLLLTSKASSEVKSQKFNIVKLAIAKKQAKQVKTSKVK